MTSKETINYLESVFAIHGIPRVLISDNARQFTSYQFESFRKEWEFKHITSSPHYPQSNGFIERTVQTVKNCLKKARARKENPQLALLSLRTTPIDNILPSPAELLFNRKVRSQIPHITRHTIKSEGTKQHLEQRQAVQKTYYDRQARNLPPLVDNQQVSVQDTNTGLWSPATIVKHSGEPRSYIIETPDGTTLRRNRQHLKESTRPQPAEYLLQPDDADAGEDTSSEGESMRQPSDPDPPRGPPPDPPSVPGIKPSTGRGDRSQTRSGRIVKAPQRLIQE